MTANLTTKIAKVLRSIALVYEGEQTFERSLESAAHLNHLAASLGDADAAAWLGWAYSEGIGVRPNISKSLRFTKIAARKGSIDALFNLANHYAEAPVFPRKVIEFYRLAAKKGHPLAMLNLGVAFEKGQGVRQNLREAIKWYQSAASNGVPIAHLNLGRIALSQGRVKRANVLFSKALKGFKARDDKNHLRCLGTMYFNGWGVNKNRRLGLGFYKKAAALGDKEAQKLIKTPEVR